MKADFKVAAALVGKKSGPAKEDETGPLTESTQWR
jgi:hypothetical protein